MIRTQMSDEDMQILREERFTHPHPQSAALGPHTTTIQEAFIAEPLHTVPEAVNRIEKLAGIRRSEPPVRPWLKNGFGHRKTGPIPAKADPVAQELFLDTQLSPALKEAPSGPRHVFFVDAAHFVLGAWLGYLGCLHHILLPTPSGRQRFNVLGGASCPDPRSGDHHQHHVYP